VIADLPLTGHGRPGSLVQMREFITLRWIVKKASGFSTFSANIGNDPGAALSSLIETPRIASIQCFLSLWGVLLCKLSRDSRGHGVWIYGYGFIQHLHLYRTRVLERSLVASGYLWRDSGPDLAHAVGTSLFETWINRRITSRMALSSVAVPDGSVLTAGDGGGGWDSASNFLLMSVRYCCASAARGPLPLTIPAKSLRDFSRPLLSLPPTAL